MPSLQTRVRELRKARGQSLSALAARIGLSRQALTAVEGGRATPSTAVALRLAQALGCTVEELFQLPADLGSSDERPGTRLVLGRVGLSWAPHRLSPTSPQAADAMVGQDGRIEPLVDPAGLRDKVLIAGCAPVLGTLSARAGRAGRSSSWLYAPSGQALRWLAEGRVHVAGMHLAQRDRPERHEELLRALLPAEDIVLVSLLSWRQGLALAPGNPLGLHAISDIDEGHRVAQRQAGSGAQGVLEAALQGRSSSGPSVRSHLEAAQALRLGAADAAVLIEPVAEACGLPFSPLSEERFDLALRREHLEHPGIVALLSELSSLGFRREVAGMGAYDLTEAGRRRAVA